MKLLEYVTNSASSYLPGTYPFQTLAAVAGRLMVALLVFKLLDVLYQKLLHRYISKVSLAVEQELLNKLSYISYDHYESTRFHENQDLALQASGQYHQAIYDITQALRMVLMLTIYTVLLAEISPFYIILLLIGTGISIRISSLTTQ